MISLHCEMLNFYWSESRIKAEEHVADTGRYTEQRRMSVVRDLQKVSAEG